MYRRSQRWMLIINNRFLSLYDYNFLILHFYWLDRFLLVIEKIRKRNSKICGSQILLLASRVILHVRDHIMVELGLSLNGGSFPAVVGEHLFSRLWTNSWMLFPFFLSVYKNSKMKNYNSKREDLEEEDQGEDERNVIL